MAIIAPLDRDILLTPSVDGQFFEYGPAGASNAVGTLVLDFRPDVTWVGQVQVMARVNSPSAVTNNATPLPMLYRRIVLNNIVSDGALVGDTLTLLGPTLIQVSANQAVSILVSCSVGSCWVYASRLQGPSTL